MYFWVCLTFFFIVVFFFKQKTAYEMRISDWSSDVCSSDLLVPGTDRDGIRPCRGVPRCRIAADQRGVATGALDAVLRIAGSRKCRCREQAQDRSGNQIPVQDGHSGNTSTSRLLRHRKNPPIKRTAVAVLYEGECR